MTTATETGVIRRWLATTLKGDTGAGGVATLAIGGIHHFVDNKSSAAYPKVIFRFQGGSDLAALGSARRVWVDGPWAVYAVCLDYSSAPIEPIAARIDTLLNSASGEATGGRILACVRETPLDSITLDNGVYTSIQGGLYRIKAQLT